jgi:ribonuclease HI
MISSQEYLEILEHELDLNLSKDNREEYQFYTDGSMGKTKDQCTRMGAAWLQTKEPNVGRKFSAGIENWPSAYKAEATVILLALLTVPSERDIEIVTDNQNCIDMMKKIREQHPKQTLRKWMKAKNWQIWLRIQHVIREKKIQVKMKKVQAHSTNNFNNEVDRLAKDAKEDPSIEWKEPTGMSLLASPLWYNLPIDISTRALIKELNKKEIVVKWTDQNRICKKWIKEIQNDNDFSWQLFWKNCKDGGSLDTSFRQKKEKAFRMKLIHNELPTLSNLFQRKPDVYCKLKLCPWCNEEEETMDHLLICKNLETARKEIWRETVNKITKKWLPKVIKDRKAEEKIIIPESLLKFYENRGEIVMSSSRNLSNFSLGL